MPLYCYTETTALSEPLFPTTLSQIPSPCVSSFWCYYLYSFLWFIAFCLFHTFFPFVYSLTLLAQKIIIFRTAPSVGLLTVGGEGWQGNLYNREECKKLLRTARNHRILHMPTERMNEWTFYYYIIWYNNRIIVMYFNCRGVTSTSLLPFYKIVALSGDGRNYRPIHFVVNVMDKWMYSHF
jgi:hypothetical protein